MTGRAFGALWGANAMSNLADGLAFVAVPLLAASLTDDPRLVAGLATVHAVVRLVVALPVGVYVDRLDRRTVIVVSNLVRAAAITALAACVHVGFASLAALYVVTALVATWESAADNAAVAVLPDLVDEAGLDRANSRISAAQLVADEFVGPPLGGFLFAVAPALPVAAMGGLWAAAGLTARAIPAAAPHTPPAQQRPALEVPGPEAPAQQRPAPEGLAQQGPAPEGLAQQVPAPEAPAQQVPPPEMPAQQLPAGKAAAEEAPAERPRASDGVRWLARHRVVGSLAVVGGLASVGYMLVFSILVLFAGNRLGLDGGGYGVILAVSALGGLAGTAVTAWVRARLGYRWTIVASLTLGAASLAGLSVTTNAVVAALLLALYILHAVVWGICSVSLRQRLVPAGLRGRVNAAARVLGLLGLALGSLAGGLLATVHVAVPVAAGAAVFAGCAIVAALTLPDERRSGSPEG